MSDPKTPFTAGERIAPARRDPAKPQRPPGSPEPPKGGRKPKKKRGLALRIAGFFVFSIYRLAFAGAIAVILLGFIGFFILSSGLPSIDSLKNYQPPLESRVYADNFQLVADLGNQHRIYVPYDQIPPVVAQAFISAEDRLFWVTPGINPLAIVRAGLVDITRIGSGHRPLGASTITEQVVKNMLLENNITPTAKLKELILAVRVGQVLTKKQILTIYLNEVDLGNNSWGVAAAAQSYFAKPLSKLDIAQAASLAALPKAPTSYNPFLHPQDALQRRNFIISRMLADGAITQAQATAAAAEPLLPHAGGEPLNVPNAGYYSDAVKSQLVQRFGTDAVANGGLIVHTSLNPLFQAAAVNAVRDGLEKYDRAYDGFHGLIAHIDDADLHAHWRKLLAHQPTPPGLRQGWRLGIVLSAGASAQIGTTDPVEGTPQVGTLPLANMRWARLGGHDNLGPRPAAAADILHPGDVIVISGDPAALALEQIPNIEAALICMDPKTGRVLAMVGGWSHDISPYNRVIQAQRQPGSSVKPFVYLTAMEQGIQPDAPVLDGPFVQQLPDGTVYRPGNYEQTFEGPIPIFHALEKSLNLATLHIARQIGLPAIAKTFESFGIIDPMPPYYPSAIGAVDTTLWRMATAYAALDNYGRQITPTLIDSVSSPQGQVLYQAAGQSCDNCVNGDPDEAPVIDYSGAELSDPDSVYQMIIMMKGVVLRGTGGPAVAGIPQPVAGKTGTTNNFNDAWFIGFTPGMLTGCWIGFDTPTNLGKDQTGGNVCGPIWNEFMKVALADQPNLDFPAPPGMILAQVPEPDGTQVTEAFKPGETPGAQNNNGLLQASQNTPDQSNTPPNGITPGTTEPGTAANTPPPTKSSMPPLY
jgi:penicillin-binding protein 1A